MLESIGCLIFENKKKTKPTRRVCRNFLGQVGKQLAEQLQACVFNSLACPRVCPTVVPCWDKENRRIMP